MAVKKKPSRKCSTLSLVRGAVLTSLRLDKTTIPHSVRSGNRISPSCFAFTTKIFQGRGNFYPSTLCCASSHFHNISSSRSLINTLLHLGRPCGMEWELLSKVDFHLYLIGEYGTSPPISLPNP